jgi:hypothetical protein
MSMLTDHETACLILALRDDKQRLMRDLAAARDRVQQLEAAHPEHWLPKSVTVSDIAAKALTLESELAAVRAEVERASKLNSEETIVLPTARLSPASSGSP